MANILCADIGTTSLKVGVINGAGEVVFEVAKSIKSQDSSFIANEWIKLFFSAVSEISENLKKTIDAISISGNGPTVVLENGLTLMWNDKEISSTNMDISYFHHASLVAKGSFNVFDTKSFFLPRIAEIKLRYPFEFEKSRFIFSCPEFLIFKLTNEAFTCLPEKRFLPYYWDENFSEKLPPFKSLTECFGKLSTDVAKKLNLREIPVFCGGPDFVASLIGTGTLSAGKICDRAGSSEGINLCVDNKIAFENENGIRFLPSVIDDLWNASVVLEKSGAEIAEFRDEISKLEGKTQTYKEIIDFSLDDKNSEGFRILNEISSNVKNGLEKLRKIADENDLPFDNVMTISGGQAKNEKWMTEKAKAVGIDIATTFCWDAELLGDAIVANVALGNFKNIKTAAKTLVRQKTIFRSSNDKKIKTIKIYRLPKKIKTLIFDIDSTLYTNPAYAFEQVDCQIRYFAKTRKMSEKDARNAISEFRKNWSAENGGKKISLGNTLTHFGVSIEESIKMREDFLHPEDFLKKDECLIKLMSHLQKKYNLICVTNNPIKPARATLKAIGISEFFENIIGLDTCKKSKPAQEVFELAAKMTNSKFSECVSIGDRYDLDLSLPLEMGMGAIWVSGVEGIYAIEEFL